MSSNSRKEFEGKSTEDYKREEKNRQSGTGIYSGRNEQLHSPAPTGGFCNLTEGSREQERSGQDPSFSFLRAVILWQTAVADPLGTGDNPYSE